MHTVHHTAGDSLLDLTLVLDHYADAGIDPAFDAECEELERRFAELRITFDRN